MDGIAGLQRGQLLNPSTHHSFIVSQIHSGQTNCYILPCAIILSFHLPCGTFILYIYASSHERFLIPNHLPMLIVTPKQQESTTNRQVHSIYRRARTICLKLYTKYLIKTSQENCRFGIVAPFFT